MSNLQERLFQNSPIDLKALSTALEEYFNKMAITYSLTKEDCDHSPSYDGDTEDLIYFTDAVLSVFNITCQPG